ncbi:hypothetical protein V5O48_000881 [Marasmius crinis-equi]|uniref:Uncharacterized protein n=1 Tax=Marasmius crinis-equi TaxID=585013 RepID=A0ABR3G038_9AGAR
MFYTDEDTLLRVSDNSFDNHLPLRTQDISQRVVFLPDIPSPELEIMLQAIYDVPSNTTQSMIDVRALTSAIDHLPVYGISPNTCITPGSHIYKFLLSCAPLHPLEVYAQAAQYGIVPLAVAASSHTLVADLLQLGDDLSLRMGSVYALRLFQLHLGRTQILKTLLSSDLGLHNQTSDCDFNGQKEMKAGWNLGVASMFHLIRPGMSSSIPPLPSLKFYLVVDTTTTLIRETILTHTDGFKCRECKKLRDKRLREIIDKWTMAPVGISSLTCTPTSKPLRINLFNLIQISAPSHAGQSTQADER